MGGKKLIEKAENMAITLAVKILVKLEDRPYVSWAYIALRVVAGKNETICVDCLWQGIKRKSWTRKIGQFIAEMKRNMEKFGLSEDWKSLLLLETKEEEIQLRT